jgi:sialate O-acetylesterase
VSVKNKIILLLLFFGRPVTAMADVSLAPCFTSNMVLQRDVPARLSGWADEGEQVRVKLGDRLVAETVGKGPDTAWVVNLPAVSAGGLPNLTVEGQNSITLTNLLAGDVWVCSGQSNMEMTIGGGPWCNYGGVENEAREIAEADHPQIRFFTSGTKTPWQVCVPETARKFSAAAYFFGRELHRSLGVPVGLVVAAAGGTPAEYWIPREAREAMPSFPDELAQAEKVMQGELKEKFDTEREASQEWREAVAAARESGQPEPKRPTPLLTPDQQEKVRVAIHTVSPGSGYEARGAPLTSMTIKGVLWYQGESNVPRAGEYADMMKALIQGWRGAWAKPDLPFVIMQLVNFGGSSTAVGPGWAELRAAQQAVADSVPGTAIATGIDLGDHTNIHPKNKEEVGRRLALAALNRVYGNDVIASGPHVTAARREDAKVVLSFDAGGKGQELVLKDDAGFELAGTDGNFRQAPAVLGPESNEITVSTDIVAEPVLIRYAWADNPPATVYNSAGLPAAPFQKALPVATHREGAE